MCVVDEVRLFSWNIRQPIHPQPRHQLVKRSIYFSQLTKQLNFNSVFNFSNVLKFNFHGKLTTNHRPAPRNSNKKRRQIQKINPKQHLLRHPINPITEAAEKRRQIQINHPKQHLWRHPINKITEAAEKRRQIQIKHSKQHLWRHPINRITKKRRQIKKNHPKQHLWRHPINRITKKGAKFK